jgi:gluconate 2-dehydrogenase alpha chain
MVERTNAIVVGLGASGGIIAEQLASAGVKVIGLDKGPNYTNDDFRLKHDEIRYYTRGSMVPQLSTDPITWRPTEQQEAVLLPWASGPLGTSEPLHLPPSIGTGGGSLHWGGACWRFRPADFRMRSAIVERFGEAALPEDSTLVDWPFGYDDLEKYYDRVEWELGVSGQAGNINGELIDGGNPFEAPRKRGYPMPPLRPAAGTAHFTEACRQLGFHPFPQAAAIASVDYKQLSGCVYCGFCHGFPCHVNAKQSSQATSIPAALETGNLEIRPFCRVFRVDVRGDSDRNRRIVGVSYFDADGQVQQLQADLVFLACYSLENVRLLLASGLDFNGQVGKHFTSHCFGWFTGTLPEFTNPFMGPLVASTIIDDLTSEIVPDNDEGVLWGSPITSFPGDVQPIEASRGIPPHAPQWGKGLKQWLADNYRRLFSMHTQTPSLPSVKYYCDLDPTHKDRFGQPALRITHEWAQHDLNALAYFGKVKRRIAREMGMLDCWEEPSPPPYHLSTHECGTHRTGEDPTASVVDPFGESHHVRGLYAVGGGQFPTQPAYNPTETIQALAFLTADHVLGRA